MSREVGSWDERRMRTRGMASGVGLGLDSGVSGIMHYYEWGVTGR